MTREELIARDEDLLEGARRAAEDVIEGRADMFRLPSWGVQYNPFLIVSTTAEPEVFRLALVNIRTAMNSREYWSKCANCSRLYLVGEHGDVVCSGECHASFIQYLNGNQ